MAEISENGAEKPKKDSSSWRLTILGGIGTLILATANNFSNWYSNLSLEESKFTRELIKTVFNEDQNPQVRRDNFLFLLDAGLVPDNDGRIRKTLKALPLDKTPSFTVDSSNALERGKSLLSKRVGGGIIYDEDFKLNVTSDGPGGSATEDPDYQAETNLRYSDGRSIDSRIVPYITLPKINLANDKVKAGDYVIVFNTSNGRQAFAVVGDIGPPKNWIDVSVALANLLGIYFDLKKGAVGTDKIICLVFPASGSGRCPESPAVIDEEGRNLFKAWLVSLR